MTTLTFKTASEDWEFEQIHRLNYQTFVEEIPQHPASPQERLVDKFHAENTYLIALSGQRLVGMVAARDKRPFSLSGKLANLEAYLPPHRAIFEIRLLAVDKCHRSPHVFQGLLQMLARYREDHGYDLAIISATVRQTKLYHQLGFIPFGRIVGAPEAQFQPMYITFEAYQGLKTRSRVFTSRLG
jgi:N-acyl-L-homoserine lactone synthetase